MTDFYKDLLSDLFKSDFLKRLLIVSLLPNVLIFGYWLNGFNNDASRLWVMFLGPYLNFEIYVFYFIIGSIALVDIAYPIVVSIVDTLKAAHVEKPKKEDYVPLSPYQNSGKKVGTNQYPDEYKYEIVKYEAPKKPEPPPPTAEEIKRKALRDITGRGA